MFKNCQQCCPQQVVNNYNTLKEALSKDFINHINKWFEEHPYVKEIYLTNRSSILYSNSMFVNKNMLKDIISTITFE